MCLHQSAHMCSLVCITAADGGAGYLDGACHGNTLKIYLHNSKAMEDFSNIQWAAMTSGQWAQSHGMHNCDASHCRLTDQGRTVEITVPNSHGGSGWWSAGLTPLFLFV